MTSFVSSYQVTRTPLAGGATWTSAPIASHRADVLRGGQAALAHEIDLAIYHEAQTFTYFVEGSDERVDWFLLATATVVGGTIAGGVLTQATVRIPSRWARVRVANGGGAPAAVLAVFVRSRVI